jgi:hypothetical protein
MRFIPVTIKAAPSTDCPQSNGGTGAWPSCRSRHAKAQDNTKVWDTFFVIPWIPPFARTQGKSMVTGEIGPMIPRLEGRISVKDRNAPFVTIRGKPFVITLGKPFAKAQNKPFVMAPQGKPRGPVKSGDKRSRGATCRRTG